MTQEVRSSAINIPRTVSLAPKADAFGADGASVDVLAGVSHELRTPLTAILGLVSLLSETPLTPDQVELCQTIRLSGETMLSLVNDLLDLYSLQAGKARVVSEAFDLQACIEEAFALAAPAALKKNLDMGVFFDPALPAVVRGDPAHLRQVLINLLSNAVKFTAHGAVELWVTAGQAGAHERWVDFAVQDSGRGIPPDQLGRLFEPFARVCSKNEPATGNGLGLAISKAWIEEMNGSITVESRPGRGSTFRVHLPFAHPDDPPALTPRMAGHILLIEPAPAPARLLSSQMQAWGLETCVAASTHEASEMLLDRCFDTVLLSNRCLSSNEEVQAVRRLLAQPALQNCRLLLLAPPGKTAQLLAYTGRSGVQVVYRPVRPSALRAALEETPPPGPVTLADWPGEPAAAPSPVDLRPLRVLVVEDDPVNQKIARLLLEKLGCPVDSVRRGGQVLTACRTRRYDALLLDVELPDVDGLTVARELIERLPAEMRPYRIAVTAHIDPGDRQRFLAGGMDDYLSKPIDKANLAAALLRALPAEPVDHLRLETYFRSASHDWQAMLAEVGKTYLETALEWLPALRQAWQQSDWPEAYRVAHSLRSASAQMAATRLAALAGRLEQDAEGLAAGSSWPNAAAPFGEQLAVIEAELAAVQAYFQTT